MKNCMLCLLLVMAMVSGCAKVPRSRLPAPESSLLPIAAKDADPVAVVELAPLASDVAALNDDLFRVAHAVRALKARVDNLSTALTNTEHAAVAHAELRGQREALLGAAAGLRDAKIRVDALQVGLPAYEAELARLRQEVVRVERAQAAARLATEDDSALRKELERAKGIAAEREKQIRELRDALEASRQVRATPAPEARVSP